MKFPVMRIGTFKEQEELYTKSKSWKMEKPKEDFI
jgi:hypothetical protein